MKIAIIGAGPAGLIAARNALHQGFSVVLYEKLERVGGIWNPDSGGAYKNARMQNSRNTFHYSTVYPRSQDEFLNVEKVGKYLSDMAHSEKILSSTQLNTEIVSLDKNTNGWVVSSIYKGCRKSEVFDRVIVTTGELWQPRKPAIPGAECFTGKMITSREYHAPETFKGQNVLVIGGGVSGADIASDLVPYAKSVALSVKKMGLYIPRKFVNGPNDMMHSYLGRYLISKMNYSRYLSYLDEALPEYMKLYRSTGMLPELANNNAVHVNEKIIPNIASGHITVVPQVERFLADNKAAFVDATQCCYDVVIFCTGYEMPDYSLITGFDRSRLYEHFFWADDPSLSVINPPVDTAGFGAAFPYFDVISQWVLGVFSGKISLPPVDIMLEWCTEHMQHLSVKRFYDSWLETIRIGLNAGVLPDPSEDFGRYWNLISSVARPAYLSSQPDEPERGRMDGQFNFETARVQILAGLGKETLIGIFKKGDISETDYHAALATKRPDIIIATLPYSQSYL